MVRQIPVGGKSKNHPSGDKRGDSQKCYISANNGKGGNLGDHSGRDDLVRTAVEERCAGEDYYD